jgi:UDP-2-acetamido-2,6-beta-L-arabino-hexul-4-ose reductase
MLKIGITGQAGFVGTHLYNTIGLFPEKYTRIPFKDSFFQNEKLLLDFISHCDIIIHLAAMNRHNDPDVIFNTNISLVKQVISACELTKSIPHVIFSSSTQEERDNLYGKSKKEGRRLFEQWAASNNAKFTGLIIPNVFGPFGLPYYNSVVATFCHQLTHNEHPKIEVDGEMKFIFVGELVENIMGIIEKSDNSQRGEAGIKKIELKHTSQMRVSELLKLLEKYKASYFQKGEIPDLDNPFNRNLFNTFLCYIDHLKFFPFKLVKNADNRGTFVEMIKLNSGGQVSFSTTVAGITRGNHFHTRKAERFAVIKGKAKIEIRRIGTEKVLSFELDGNQPSFVDMPVWYTHNITNTGEDDLYTIFWISEHFDAGNPDTFFEKV